MISREPHWRTVDKQDWGFSPLSRQDWIKEIFAKLGQLMDPLIYIGQRRKINNALKGFDKRCVSLGSGTNIPEGWIGFDRYKSGRNVFPVNLHFQFPLPKSCIDEILAEHIVEHFFFDDIIRLLRECYRVLSAGGKLRLVCPDAVNLAKLILEQENGEAHEDVLQDAKIHCWPNDGLLWARTINRLSHQWGQHKSILSAKMLEQLLEKVGFDRIVILKVNQTVHFEKPPDIHQKRFPEESPGMSFAVEARVPDEENSL